MRTRISVVLLALVTAVIARPSATKADYIIGWADEFLAGHFECYKPSNKSTANCGAISNFERGHWSRVMGNSKSTALDWAFLGQQSIRGKANARGKVMYRFSITNNTGWFTLTASYDRFRRVGKAVPYDGYPCKVSSTEDYIGLVSQTFDSTAAGDGGTQINNRFLPVFDFTAERGVGDVGYRDVIRGYGGSGDQVPASSGCYKIRWF